MSDAKEILQITKENAEEKLLEYKKSGDKELLDALVSHYKYIPEILSRRYSRRGAEFDDIYQVACIGLLNAINRFDETKNVRFVTFATPTIIGEIKHFFRDKGCFIKVPRRMYETFSKANKIHAANLSDDKKESTEELAKAIGVSPQKLKNALLWGDSQFVHSLEQFISADDSDKTFTDVIGFEDNHFLMIENRDFFDKFFLKLNEDEKKLLDLRFEQELSQTETAKILGVSQMTVSRMEKKILAILRKMHFDMIAI